MKRLSFLQSALFAFGALLMVIGSGLVVFRTMVPTGTIVFAIGAFLFAGIQMMQGYKGTNFTIKRLRRIIVFSDICIIVAALLMIETNYQIIKPYVATTIDGYNMWIRVVYNNWGIALLIGALLQMYGTHRISSELKKENKQ